MNPHANVFAQASVGTARQEAEAAPSLSHAHSVAEDTDPAMAAAIDASLALKYPAAQDKQADDAIVPHIQYSELAVESSPLAAGSFKSVYKARWMRRARVVALLCFATVITQLFRI